jgi:hypothetical protein
VQVKKDVLGVELKMLREEGHRAALELRERRQRASTLAAKHAMLCSTLVGADGFDFAEERSQVLPDLALHASAASCHADPAMRVCFVPVRDELHSCTDDIPCAAVTQQCA